MIKKFKPVTFVCINLECGGSEKVIIDLANHYSKKNISISIITFGKSNLFKGFKLSPNTKLIELRKLNPINFINKFKNIFIWFFAIKNYIRNHQDSIYISFLTIPNILTILASLNLKIIHYGSERCNPKDSKLSTFWVLIRYLVYFRLKNLILQTEELKIIFSKYTLARNFKVIPNSVDDKFSKVNTKINTKKNKLQVLFIGRFEYIKGIDILLDTIIRISNSEIKSKYFFTIVGDGSLKELVDRKIAVHNLDSLISLHTETNNPEIYMKNADVIIHPSRSEGMSNVVIEGMACGKCVISTFKTSGSIIKNKKDGILIKKLSPNEIIKTLEFIFGDKKNILKKIEVEAINTIYKKYSSKKIFKMWDKLILIPQK